MNRKLMEMVREIERRGGVIHISGPLPEDVTEQFLEQILSCPDCGVSHPAERDFDPEEVTIDKVLAGTPIPRRFGGH